MIKAIKILLNRSTSKESKEIISKMEAINSENNKLLNQLLSETDSLLKKYNM